ncbi:hypothetical protein D3C76_960160 [compost metagenome]
MGQIGQGLLAVRNGVAAGHLAVAQAFKLGKDEPHPVAVLMAGAQLGNGAFEGRFLGIDETLQVVGVMHGVHPWVGAPSLWWCNAILIAITALRKPTQPQKLNYAGRRKYVRKCTKTGRFAEVRVCGTGYVRG